MSTGGDVAYNLHESGGVDYKEGKVPDKSRPQLPPDISGKGMEGGKSLLSK
jgi:hypothetical protein